jgi:hypothetical protein
MIRTNRSHNLRTNVVKPEPREILNTKPIKANYVHNRVAANFKHFDQCLKQK